MSANGRISLIEEVQKSIKENLEDIYRESDLAHGLLTDIDRIQNAIKRQLVDNMARIRAIERTIKEFKHREMQVVDKDLIEAERNFDVHS